MWDTSSWEIKQAFEHHQGKKIHLIILLKHAEFAEKGNHFDMKVKVKLRFSAPSAGIAEIE